MKNKKEFNYAPIKSFLKHLFDSFADRQDFFEREGIFGTPRRVFHAWEEALSGYKMNPKELLKTSFAEDLNGYDQIIVLKDIDFVSTCEHHLLPFFGTASIGYLPDKKVVGISKLARLVECFARRLQIQERMTESIKEQINTHLNPRGVGVIIEAQHFCITSRGIKKQKAKMVTSAFSGLFLAEDTVKSEFLRLIGK